MRDLNPGVVHDVPPFSLEGNGCGCDISPDSKELAFTEKDVPDEAISTNSDIFTLDLTDPAAKPVKVSTSPGGDLSPAYSPDGKYLAWRSQARTGYESDKFRLVVLERVGKPASQQVSAPAIRDLLPKFDNWVDEFAWFGSQWLTFTSGRFGEEDVFSVNVTHGRLVLMAFGGTFSGLHFATLPPKPGVMYAAPSSIIASKMNVGQPLEVVSVIVSSGQGICGNCANAIWTSANAGSASPITHLNDALLAQLDLPKMESFWFTAKDGTKLQGFLIRPPGFDPAKKYPVKFLIHGGPQGNWGDSWSYRWNAELFAANGYVVVMINPRGSTGYGQAIVDGVNGDWGGKPFTDLMTGLDYAEQHYPFIDSHRECALGASYGGYMANWVLGHTNRFKCIVSHDGMFDAESAFGSTEEDWFNIWEFRGHPWDYYGKPDDQNPYRKWSPSLYAKNFHTPTLVVHGQLDYRLDVSEGFQLFDTLQMLGVPSKMLYFPDEGHWVLKPQNSQLWWKTVNDWVDQWTQKAASSH
jgi:dipeptidyl aminopeptidase/acylaminoacyl peptidase